VRSWSFAQRHSRERRNGCVPCSLLANPTCCCGGDSLVFAQQLRQWLQMQPFLAVQIEGLELTGYLPLIQQCQPRLANRFRCS
jgi:hypothetical protein